WEYGDLPLGEMVRPSVRWILRRHRLADTPLLRELYVRYLASACSQAEALRRRLTDHKPRALVVFNGIFFPEAIARRLAQSMGIPVVTHEVGLRPFSAFFSHREATFRELSLPADFELSSAQETELDGALSRRFRGDFSMAGIRFWPEMRGLPESLLDNRRSYRQMVSVFTNVIFDTSQAHANVLFEDMWAWLDDLIQVMRREVDTLFVLRAHPDETRRGKESEESVAAWFRASGLATARNVVFIPPDDPVSSYELLQASKFILVYNSSVGLEASILGRPALCAGRARFTQMETTYFPADRSEYRRRLEELLGAERPQVPEVQRRNARAFLYYELFHASLDLSEFLLPDPSLQGMVLFSDFAPERLAQAAALQVLRDGILHARPFVAPAEAAEPAAALPT
ncbi:MAG TPA: hypothetical protein VFI11_03920, partial [Anaerolineales bacterium]|nr:hypothetical protein [Anaerolineales bacterium]